MLVPTKAHTHKTNNMNCECGYRYWGDDGGHWMCCTCEREFCPLMDQYEPPLFVDAGRDCTQKGCIAPVYDRRILDLVPRTGTGCRCHPNVNLVVHGDKNGVVACGCTGYHYLCYECVRDPVKVTKQDKAAQLAKNPQLTDTEALRAAYQEKLLEQSFKHMCVSDE